MSFATMLTLGRAAATDRGDEADIAIIDAAIKAFARICESLRVMPQNL